jgi:hypothetical protein
MSRRCVCVYALVAALGALGCGPADGVEAACAPEQREHVTGQGSVCLDPCVIGDARCGLRGRTCVDVGGEGACVEVTEQGCALAGLTVCGTQCADLERDGYHCGACGVRAIWGCEQGEVLEWPRAVRLETGLRHSCALTDSGRVYCWGRNAHGQLGDLTFHDRAGPVRVWELDEAVDVSPGHEHTCAATARGQAWCWGQNVLGQLGVGSREDALPGPQRVEGPEGVTRVGASHGHSCAIARGGKVWCWGRSSGARPGPGGTPARWQAVEVAGIEQATGLAVGVSMGCAQTASGEVRCWGGVVVGEPDSSEGGTWRVEVDEVSAIMAEGLHACAVTRAGEVWCWGAGEFGPWEGEYGPDGLVSAGRVEGLSGVSGVFAGGCVVYEDGVPACWSPPHGAFVELEGVEQVEALTVTASRTCAAGPDGRVWCWTPADEGGWTEDARTRPSVFSWD